MRRRTIQVGAILALVAMLIFALPVCTWLYVRSANHARAEKIKLLVEKYPHLQAAWEQAMQDDALTASEAQDIEQRAGETTAPPP